ncbi:hypothetical protein [Synechococcus sp. UW179A]|uniref:hypothetical protein n=1 Tax=Synechococcus sp. UW179A TaxID=2575510 RepID=UPI0010BE3F37|nr:hypothetical protein [Synechococcus sp. UW179A]
MESTQSLVAFADHITTVLTIEDLRVVSKALFDIGLPVGWPLSEQPGFSTAGIRLGNLNLELCAVDRQQNALDDWLTFEPTNLDSLESELVARGIEHDPFDAVVIQGNPIYTRVGLPGLSVGKTALQLCHTFYPTRTSGPIAPKNSAGIQAVTQVIVGMDDAHKQIMRNLLVPQPWTESIDFLEGPSLAVSSAQHLEIKSLEVRVDNTCTAVKTLTAAGMSRVNEHMVQIGSLKLALRDS